MLLSRNCFDEKRCEMKRHGYSVISMISFFMSSIFALCISIINRQQHLTASNILAALFWFTLISGIVFCVMLARKTKPSGKTKFRLLCFFRGKALIVIDTAQIVSILCTVVISALHINNTLLWAAFIFLDIFFIEFHCLFCMNNQEVYK